MKNKIKFLICVSLVAILIMLPLNAMASVPEKIHASRTETFYNTNLGDIPKSHYHVIYQNGYVYKGNLPLEKVIDSSRPGIIVARYSGYVYIDYGATPTKIDKIK